MNQRISPITKSNGLNSIIYSTHFLIQTIGYIENDSYKTRPNIVLIFG